MTPKLYLKAVGIFIRVKLSPSRIWSHVRLWWYEQRKLWAQIKLLVAKAAAEESRRRAALKRFLSNSGGSEGWRAL